MFDTRVIRMAMNVGLQVIVGHSLRCNRPRPRSLDERAVTMKSGIICFVAVLTFVSGVASAHPGHDSQLSEELRPLQFMIGDWVAEWESDEAMKWKIAREIESEAGGHAIRESGRVYRDGELISAWVDLTCFKDGQLIEIRVGPNGVYSEGNVTANDGTVVTKVNRTNRRGGNIRFEQHSKMVDENSFTTQRVNIVTDGEPRDAWSPVTFRRLK